MRGLVAGLVLLALLVGSAGLEPRSAAAQAGIDLSTAPLPESVRNALARPATESERTAGLAALQEGPVDPARYILGVGDELTVHYTGRTSATHRLIVSPEGNAYLPDVGSVPLAGQTLDTGKTRLKAAANRILRDVRVDVSLTRLRTFKISVGGEVRRPGVYAATAVTRVHELIREAGGLTDSAAVRDMQLGSVEGGEISHVDLLPFLLAGRMGASNPAVVDGQALFVPRRSRLVSVVGAVLHPGTYDLPDTTTTVGAFLDLVGLAPNAALDRIELIPTSGIPGSGLALIARGKPNESPDGDAVSRGLSATGPLALEHGNQILVPEVGGFARPELVTVDGEVRYPGSYSVAGGEHRVGDLILEAGGFTPEAIPSRVRLVRPVAGAGAPASIVPPLDHPAIELTATEKEYLRARGISDFRAALVDLSRGPDAGAPGGGGPVLMPGDRILVPRAGRFVEVSGRVKRPGFYAHQPGRDAGSYVKEAGGFADRADRKNLRIATGPGDSFLLASDAGPPEPGDRVWVPERTPRSTWEVAKDFLLVAGQVATIFIVINQAGE